MTHWRFIATLCLCVTVPSLAGAQSGPPANPKKDHLGLGAGLGAVAMSALAIPELNDCGAGCEVGSGAELPRFLNAACWHGPCATRRRVVGPCRVRAAVSRRQRAVPSRP